ncbi:MAG: alanine racemase, partial [Gammaproteobacteria bacterium]|nr:alanine racemase [Gammaproteobacteria bacterium]
MSSNGMNSNTTTSAIAGTTKAVINLSACRHNLSIAKESSPGSKLIAVIKANAYGHGMLNIANALTEADAFAVARMSEAVELRGAGISKPILLLEGFTSEEELNLVREYQLECVIHHETQLALLEQAKGDAITIWVKVDTGMHRLGFNPDDIKNICQRLEKNQVIKLPVKLMTHLANADDKHDDKTLKQLDVFYKSIEGLSVDETSIANSAGILGWPQSHANWNRPGIM